MNTHNLSSLLQGLAEVLGASFSRATLNDMAKICEMLNRYPDQSVGSFVKFVDDTVSKDRNSVPSLIGRIEALKEAQGESLDELLASLKKATAGDLSKILKALGQPARGKKAEKYEHLETYLTSGGSLEDSPAVRATDRAQQAEDAFSLYSSIRKGLSRLSVDDVRARFGQINEFDRDVLANLLRRLGYSASGSKRELASQLLSNLERMHISETQRKLI